MFKSSEELKNCLTGLKADLNLKYCMYFSKDVWLGEGYFLQTCALFGGRTLGDKFPVHFAQYQEDNEGD